MQFCHLKPHCASRPAKGLVVVILPCFSQTFCKPKASTATQQRLQKRRGVGSNLLPASLAFVDTTTIRDAGLSTTAAQRRLGMARDVLLCVAPDDTPPLHCTADVCAARRRSAARPRSRLNISEQLYNDDANFVRNSDVLLHPRKCMHDRQLNRRYELKDSEFLMILRHSCIDLPLNLVLARRRPVIQI
eukprot:4247522-Pleurochrysis_carterae.AAC.4